MKDDSIVENGYTEASLVKITCGFEKLCTVKVLDLGIAKEEADRVLKHIESQVMDTPLLKLLGKLKGETPRFTLEMNSRNPSMKLLCIGRYYVTYNDGDCNFAIDIKIPEHMHLEKQCVAGTGNGFSIYLAPRKLCLESIAAVLRNGMPLAFAIGKNGKPLMFSSFEELMIDADLKS